MKRRQNRSSYIRCLIGMKQWLNSAGSPRRLLGPAPHIIQTRHLKRQTSQ